MRWLWLIVITLLMPAPANAGCFIFFCWPVRHHAAHHARHHAAHHASHHNLHKIVIVKKVSTPAQPKPPDIDPTPIEPIR